MRRKATKWRIERCEYGRRGVKLWRATEAGCYGVTSPPFATRAEAVAWTKRV